MTIIRTSVLSQYEAYYFQCAECGTPLMDETLRHTGLCTPCAAERMAVKVDGLLAGCDIIEIDFLPQSTPAQDYPDEWEM